MNDRAFDSPLSLEEAICNFFDYLVQIFSQGEQICTGLP
jgi:hypothetical protein